jgi:hypothetical protein
LKKIEQISNLIGKLKTVFDDLIADNKNLKNQLEDKSRYVSDNERIKKDLINLKKTHRDELDKLLREKEEIIKENEKLKCEEMRNLEKNHKQIVERLKNKLHDTEETNELLNNENVLLKGQLSIFDKNINNLTNSKKDLEYTYDYLD